MIEQTVSIERMEDAIDIFGSFDENIRIIEQELAVRVVSRDDQLKISGEEDEAVDQAAKVIQGLLSLSARGETIHEQNVRYLIQLVKSGNERFTRWIYLGVVAGLAGSGLVAVLFPFLLDGGLVGQKNFFANMVFLCVGFALMGIAFGPIGAFLPELFDANVRYSGSGIGYNLAAIVGAAFVPTIATWLSHHWGVHSVGLYLGVMAVCCLVAVLSCKETKDVDFTK